MNGRKLEKKDCYRKKAVLKKKSVRLSQGHWNKQGTSFASIAAQI